MKWLIEKYFCLKKEGIDEMFIPFLVGLQGLEPWITEPESVVLPLHHRPLCIAGQSYDFFLNYTIKKATN